MGINFVHYVFISVPLKEFISKNDLLLFFFHKWEPFLKKLFRNSWRAAIRKNNSFGPKDNHLLFLFNLNVELAVYFLDMYNFLHTSSTDLTIIQ